MQRMTITIPQHDNERKYFPTEVFNRIQEHLIATHGGFTVIDVTGQWKDDSGTVYTDESYRYEILVNDVIWHYKDLKDYARDLRRDLHQKCVLTTCETIQADFVE